MLTSTGISATLYIVPTCKAWFKLASQWMLKRRQNSHAIHSSLVQTGRSGTATTHRRFCSAALHAFCRHDKLFLSFKDTFYIIHLDSLTNLLCLFSLSLYLLVCDSPNTILVSVPYSAHHCVVLLCLCASSLWHCFCTNKNYNDTKMIKSVISCISFVTAKITSHSHSGVTVCHSCGDRTK